MIGTIGKVGTISRFGGSRSSRIGPGSTAPIAYAPSMLFSANEVGVWYDPSDLSTLYQDSAGTTPVTAAGQSVGLMLDKSRGLQLGPELVVNGGFDDATGWTFSGSAAPVTGELVFVAGGAGNATQPISIDANRGVRLRVDKTAFGVSGAANVQIFLRNGSTNVAIINLGGATGLMTFDQIFFLSAPVTNVLISYNGSGAYEYKFDNISVRELPGNHATQSNAARRPTYGVVPATGRRNLLTYTERFDNAVWTKASQGSASIPVVTANAGTDPLGGNTAERVQFSRTGTTTVDRSRIEQQNIPVSASTTYTFSVWVRSYDGSSQTITFYPNFGAGTGGVFTVDGTWQRLSVTNASGVSTTASVVLGLGYYASAATSSDVLIWGAQLETGSTATAYQRVGNNFDVTEAGVPSLSYLSFDGTDDGMLTGNIVPGTDKMSVFAGVRKLSNAAVGMVCEFSPNVNTNAGTFWLAAPITPAANYSFASKGTTAGNAQYNNAAVAAPITNVLTGIGDIAADTAILRVNGTQVATSATDQGTGNYLAYPLYIGRRGGTTLPFNGCLYGLIVRFGANLNVTTVQQTEEWINSKTGAY